MKIKHLKLNIIGLVIALFSIFFDYIMHQFFESAFPTFQPEIFRYFAIKFLVIYLTYILFMYFIVYSKSKFIYNRVFRPIIIAFVAMIIFSTYYYFYPSNTDPATLPSLFFPLMGLNHFIDILIAILLIEFLTRKIKNLGGIE